MLTRCSAASRVPFGGCAALDRLKVEAAMEAKAEGELIEAVPFLSKPTCDLAVEMWKAKWNSRIDAAGAHNLFTEFGWKLACW
jgi:hypothetical protein